MPILKVARNKKGEEAVVYDQHGLKNDPDFIQVYTGPKPKVESWYDPEYGWNPTHAVDDHGNYLGTPPYEEVVNLVFSAPPNGRCIWDFRAQEWIDVDNEDEFEEVFDETLREFQELPDNEYHDLFMEILQGCQTVTEIDLLIFHYRKLALNQEGTPNDLIVFEKYSR